MFYYNINGENSIDPPEPEPNPNHPQIMWWRKPETLQTAADYEAGRAESHQLIARLPPHLGEKLLLGLCPGGRAGRNYFQPQLNGEPPPQQRLLKFIFDDVMKE